MPWRNSAGQAVDPVPFYVSALSGGLVSLSFGPFYLQSFGLGLDAAIAGSALLAVAVGLGSYYRFVWTFSPERLEEVPVASRMARLGYAMVIFLLVLLAISLPIVLEGGP